MGKYDALGHFLITSGRMDMRLSFSEIERILGFALPRSAYSYPAWWSNGGHSQADAWMRAGYEVRQLDIQGQVVHFCRVQLFDHLPSTDTKFRCSKRNNPRQMEPSQTNKNEGKLIFPNNPKLMVCGYEFVFVQNLVPECENGKVKEYYPQSAYTNKDRLPLLTHGAGAFCRFSIQAPALPGVYLWVVDGQIIYIGETRNLQQRFNVGYGNISPRNCYLGGQSTNCKMNKVVMEYYKRGKTIGLYFYQTEDYKQMELHLLSRFNTKYNVKDN